MSQNNNQGIFSGNLGLAAVIVSVIMAITAGIVFFAFAEEFNPTPTTPYAPTPIPSPLQQKLFLQKQLSQGNVSISGTNPDGSVRANHEDNPCYLFEGTDLTIMSKAPWCESWLDIQLGKGWKITSTDDTQIYLTGSTVG